MRATYFLLNLAFFFIAWALLGYFKLRSKQPRPEFFLALVALYFMMIVFNTFLTSLPIVIYDWEKTLGMKIISWPIEDLAYLVVALYAAPLVWERLKEYHERTESPASEKQVNSKQTSAKDRIRPRQSSSKRRGKRR